jgi:hypothetical protein
LLKQVGYREKKLDKGGRKEVKKKFRTRCQLAGRLSGIAAPGRAGIFGAMTAAKLASSQGEPQWA